MEKKLEEIRETLIVLVIGVFLIAGILIGQMI